MNQCCFNQIKVLFCFFAVFLLVFPAVWAQEGDETAENSLPMQFRELTLGMSMDDLKAALVNDTLFNFRGDRDVSFLPAREENLIETSGSSFIRRAFFQIRDGALFIMSFTLNTDMVDHYSVFTTFVQKYGQPSDLNPRESVWENDDVRITVERPLTVKYIDKKAFNDIINESELVQSRRVRLNQEFLNEF